MIEKSNVEEMSTEPLPESKDTSTAANHSFPANTARNSETRRKSNSGKIKALSQLLALEERKTEQLEEGCATEIDYVYSGRRRLPHFDEFGASS